MHWSAETGCERDPERPIIIAADNDHHLPRRQSPLSNVGQENATAAAQAVAGIVLTPAFATTDKGTDWNDYAAQHGKAAVLGRFQADRDAARQRTTHSRMEPPLRQIGAATDAARAAERQQPSRFTP